MRDTIRGIVGKLRKGIYSCLLVAVDMKDYSIHSFIVEDYGIKPMEMPDLYIIGWYKYPIKMSALRDHIERRIGGSSI